MASARPGPFQDFYQAALAKGIKPTMARLTLAGSIAAIVAEARQDLSEAESPIRLKVRTAAEDPAPAPSPFVTMATFPAAIQLTWDKRFMSRVRVFRSHYRSKPKVRANGYLSGVPCLV